MLEKKRSKKDRQLFQSHLRIPLVYLQIIDKLFPNNLSAVPYHLHKIIMNVHDVLGRTMVHDINYDKLVVYGGIPPQFITEAPIILGKQECLDTIKSIEQNISKFIQTGVILYLASPYETSAVAAASTICKAAYAAKLTFKMMDYPRFVEMCTDFKGDHKEALNSLTKVDITCLYMVGKEYTTDFNVAQMKTLVSKRTLDNKVTILSSHLTLEEFTDRYGTDLSITPIQLTDRNNLTGFKALKRLLED